MMPDHAIKRRRLLQASMGLATGASLTRSANAETHLPYDASYDVVVVGSGMGLCAALRAANASLDVLVLEQNQAIGGTTLVSGGVLWIPNNPIQKADGIADSREASRTYLEQLSQCQGSAASG